MSETIEDGATQGVPATEPAPQPETNDAPAPGTEQTATDEQPKPDDKPKIDPKDRALRQAAFEARELKRQLAAVQDQLTKAVPKDPDAPPSQAELERIVDQRAQQLIAQREQQAKTQAWLEAGHAEFSDFDARCNQLADMGAGDNKAFMAAITRPGGHKLVAALAENPAEVTRLLKLPPVDMAWEAATLAQKDSAPAPKPKPATKAPEPIKPITGQARGEPDPEKLDGDAFAKWFHKARKG